MVTTSERESTYPLSVFSHPSETALFGTGFSADFLNVQPAEANANVTTRRGRTNFFIGRGGYLDEKTRIPAVCMAGLYSMTNGAVSVVFRRPETLAD